MHSRSVTFSRKCLWINSKHLSCKHNRISHSDKWPNTEVSDNFLSFQRQYFPNFLFKAYALLFTYALSVAIISPNGMAISYSPHHYRHSNPLKWILPYHFVIIFKGYFLNVPIISLKDYSPHPFYSPQSRLINSTNSVWILFLIHKHHSSINITEESDKIFLFVSSERLGFNKNLHSIQGFNLTTLLSLKSPCERS